MNHSQSLPGNLRLRGNVLWLAAIIFSTVITCEAVQIQSTKYDLPAGQQFTNAGRQLLSISPDGKQFVFVANRTLFLKALADKDAKEIAGVSSNGVVANPVFSPDGKSIAYWSGQDQTIKRIPVTGGTPTTICQTPMPYGMSWGPDNTIVFGMGENGIRRVAASGGTAETIVTLQNRELAHGPQILPDGKNVLYTLAVNPPAQSVPADLLNNPQLRNQLSAQDLADLLNNLGGGLNWDNARIVVQSLTSKEPKTLIQDGRDARYLPTGYLVYAKGQNLMAVRFDPQRLEVSGTPIKLLGDVTNAGSSTGTSQFSFSSTGAFAYISTAPQVAASQRQMAFVDLDGKVTPLRHVPASIFGPRISPTGKEVAYRDGNSVWIADLFSEKPPRQLTKEPGEGPIWSPDGERIAFISIYKGMEALYWRRSDGSGDAELLVERARAPESWSAARQEFSFITLIGPSGDAGDYDIWTYSVKDKKASPLINIPSSAQSGSRFSPDGKWIAYESNESGRAEVYVEPLPHTGQRFQISKAGGARPLWSPDGSKLYYDNNGGNNTRILFVNVKTQPSFTWGDAQTLPMTGFVQPQGTIRRQYDITPDGKQFLVTFPPPQIQPQINILNNGFDQLKQR